MLSIFLKAPPPPLMAPVQCYLQGGKRFLTRLKIDIFEHIFFLLDSDLDQN